MAAELFGKLKGRKWKEFRQQECGASTIEVVFPSTVAPKYSGDSPEKARTLTCADQFNANKASNGNGGMKWIEKGGGYYSERVVRLKGGSCFSERRAFDECKTQPDPAVS